MATIALTVVLGTVIAIASMFAGEINPQAHDIAIKVILGFGGITAGLVVILRQETMNGKIDDAAIKADEAAVKAAIAAERAAVVEKKVDAAHHDLLNGGLRENVKRAYAEIEEDPIIMARRIELAALGVQKDRHEKANREARKPIREQLEARGMPKRDTTD